MMESTHISSLVDFCKWCCNQEVPTEPSIVASHFKKVHKFLLAFRNRVIHNRLYFSKHTDFKRSNVVTYFALPTQSIQSLHSAF